MARTHNLALPQGGTIKIGDEDRLPEQVSAVYESLSALGGEVRELQGEIDQLTEVVEDLRKRLGRLERPPPPLA
jgi:predicted nuclease with TOPRIM domain